MIEIRHVSIAFGGGVSSEEAEEIVGQALRLAARMLPHQDGLLSSVRLPDVGIAPGMGIRASSEALADALVCGITDAQEKSHA